MSQNVAQVILIIAQTLIIIVRLILYFVIIMGIVQYFLRRGENVKRPVKEKKKKEKEKIMKRSVKTILHLLMIQKSC